ncbi:MAG: FAD-binding oxidoreductase [Gemmatimonadota bacterium]|nr:FAD-binding oxidoreductase [Gemmatimonadota bacterium]
MFLQNWWYTTLLGVEAPASPPLTGDHEADLVIVGAGMAGICAALRAMKSGRRVTILERNVFGGSSTGKSAGFLTPDSELELSQLMRRFGPQGAKDLWSVPVRGIEIILATAREHGFSCDLIRQDSLYLGKGSSGAEAVREEAKSRKALGFASTVYSAADLRQVVGSDAYTGGIRYADTYGIDALQFAQQAKQVLLAGGVRVHESTEVLEITDHVIRTHLGTVRAEQVIVCADKLTRTFTPHAANVYHAQTFLSISEPLGDAEIASLFPSEPLQCWNSDLVYSYFRLTGDHRLLLGGGSALTTFSLQALQSERVIASVVREFRRAFPQLRNVRFVQYWPGLIDTTRDLLPTVLRDDDAPWLHFVLGCVGLPWAAFCGDFAARHVLDPGNQDDRHYYHYFRPDRPFFVPLWAEGVMGKPLVFALNNAWAKYVQVDRTR